MAAGDRVLARVREEDKTVNEGNHVLTHRDAPGSCAWWDDWRRYPLANGMDYHPLPRTTLPARNTRGQALQLGPKESKTRGRYADVSCNRKGSASASAEEDRYDGS